MSELRLTALEAHIYRSLKPKNKDSLSESWGLVTIRSRGQCVLSYMLTIYCNDLERLEDHDY